MNNVNGLINGVNGVSGVNGKTVETVYQKIWTRNVIFFGDQHLEEFWSAPNSNKLLVDDCKAPSIHVQHYTEATPVHTSVSGPCQQNTGETRDPQKGWCQKSARHTKWIQAP